MCIYIYIYIIYNIYIYIYIYTHALQDLYYADPAVGPAAVADLLQKKVLPAGSRWVLDRVSDGKASCGFTWHIEQEGVGVGLRGLSFLRLDAAGKVTYNMI